MDTPSNPRVTIKSIALAVGLSPGAVSLALRNSPEVSKETCERVQKLAREMGYQPNPLAAGLAKFKRDSRSVPIQAALAWLNFWSPPTKLRSYGEFDRYWKGATDAAEQYGYHLEEFRCLDLMPVDRLEEVLLSRGIHGLLIAPGILPPEVADFHWNKFSVVRLSRSKEDLKFHVVTGDQHANAILAFEMARKRGYKRIGFIGPHWSTRLFASGYLWAQTFVPQEERLPPLLLKDGTDDVSIQHLLFDWLETNHPDAVLTEAIELAPILRRIGCRVPEDLAVAALNVIDQPFDAGIYPNPEEVGRVSILAAISFIYDQACGVPPIQREVLVKGHWVDGKSLPQVS